MKRPIKALCSSGSETSIAPLRFLRGGQRKHSNHFAIAANLGTAWQLKGNFVPRPNRYVRPSTLPPGKWLAAEELHLKLVLGRLKQKQPGQELDDLFGVRYFLADSNEMADAERKKLTPRAVGLNAATGALAPADGPLLWQLAGTRKRLWRCAPRPHPSWKVAPNNLA